MSIQILKRKQGKHQKQGASDQDCCCDCKSSEIVDFTNLDANGTPRIINTSAHQPEAHHAWAHQAHDYVEQTERKEDNLDIRRTVRFVC